MRQLAVHPAGEGVTQCPQWSFDDRGQSEEPSTTLCSVLVSRPAWCIRAERLGDRGYLGAPLDQVIAKLMVCPDVTVPVSTIRAAKADRFSETGMVPRCPRGRYDGDDEAVDVQPGLTEDCAIGTASLKPAR